MNENITTGTILNERYRLDEKIGHGGMADVWLAEDKTLGRKVAIKIMLPQFSNDPEFARRFKREASAAACLKSPYIVNIYDWGVNDSIQYIVMEYIQGEDLKDIISENGPVPQKRAAKIGVQACKALAVAHQQDIIHRDIKPQNIMVQSDGDIKVMDFGIAHSKNSTDQKTQVVLGTAHYVSPEQAQGLDLTARSDIYSLGIVLYETVTGKVPFNGEDAVTVALKQCNEDPVPPSYYIPDLDSQFEEIILKAMAKNPQDRFNSATEMQQALMDYIEGKRSYSAMVAETAVMTPAGTDATALMPNVSNGNPRNMNGVADEEKPPMDPKKKKMIIGGSIAGGVALLAIIIAIVCTLFGAKVTVPDVYGMNEEEAIAALEQVELSIGDIEEIPSTDVPKGQAISTDPEAGTEVNKGDNIVLNISSGPQEVKVPRIKGLSEEDALKALEKAGLIGQKSGTEPSADIPEGDVTSQNPSANAKVEPGSVVYYIISSGAEDVVVPSLENMTEDEAMKALEELGLTGLVASRQASDDIEEGKVISQNPQSGLTVEVGSQVTFTISTGLAEIDVPSLIGLTQSAARSTLINAGFVVGEITEEYSDEPKGTVAKQSIEYGESAAKGTAINIVISKGEKPSSNNNNNNTNNNSQPNNNHSNNNGSQENQRLNSTEQSGDNSNE